MPQGLGVPAADRGRRTEKADVLGIIFTTPPTAPIMMTTVRISALILLSSLVACDSGAPDPKPICAHVDKLVKANEAEWVGVDVCVEKLSLVPTGDKEAWAAELECLGKAADQPAARKCASWLNTSLRLEQPDPVKAGKE